jgi:hypothetical protein
MRRIADNTKDRAPFTQRSPVQVQSRQDRRFIYFNDGSLFYNKDDDEWFKRNKKGEPAQKLDDRAVKSHWPHEWQAAENWKQQHGEEHHKSVNSTRPHDEPALDKHRDDVSKGKASAVADYLHSLIGDLKHLKGEPEKLLEEVTKRLKEDLAVHEKASKRTAQLIVAAMLLAS